MEKIEVKEVVQQRAMITIQPCSDRRVQLEFIRSFGTFQFTMTVEEAEELMTAVSNTIAKINRRQR